MKSTWKEKLNPKHFPEMSSKMAAIVGVMTGEKYTTPSLVELSVTFDSMVLGMIEGDVGFTVFLGGEEDLLRNWNNLLDAADLSPSERRQAMNAYRYAIKR